jgi:hypothetical protein
MRPNRPTAVVFRVVATLAALIVAVLLYVLSVGPVAWLGYRGYIPQGVSRTYREPLYRALKPLEPSILIEFQKLYEKWWLDDCR